MAGLRASVTGAPREATLERAQQRGAEEAIRLYKVFLRIAESAADTRIRWALDR